MKFIFKGYNFNLEKGKLFFHFGFEGERDINFTEKLTFLPVDSAKIPQNLIKSILDGLLLILGVSYWKLYCPKNIVLETISLSKEQAEFWNTVYTKGMGEFYYKNKIDFRGLVNFPFSKKVTSSPINFPRQNRYLVGIGGGKDSIVAAELLRKENKQFDLVTSGFPIQIEIAKMIGGKIINTFRQIDPKLLELNKEKDTHNGHVPISVYYAFLLLLMATLFDYKHLIVGNERSANYGNVEYLGEIINHQWSKSEEFEKLFNEYVRKFITPDITYSSPLRKVTELEVVREFVKYPKYFKVFSSCNSNYKINNFHLGGAVKRRLQGSPLRPHRRKACRIETSRMDSSEVLNRWCGKCPKCLFMFICLVAYLSKEKVLDIFGKNLFEDKNLISLFEELIGTRNFKPFECVGTPEEVRKALKKILARGEFESSFLIKHFKSYET